MRGYSIRNATLLFTAVWLVATAADIARAQRPRTRSLTLNPSSKEWVELPPPPIGTAEGDLHAIRVQIKDGRYRSSLRAIKRFVKKYGEADPQYPAVQIAKAEALIGRRDYYKAYVLLQDFLRRFGGTQLTSEALRLKFVVAETFLTGVKRKFLGIRMLSGENVGLQILDELSVDYPDSEWAEYAIKTKADYLFYRSAEHGLAELEYTRLLTDYPRSRYYQPAMRHSADAVLASFRGVEYDEAALLEAEERYHDYEVRFRASAEREGIDSIVAGIQQQRAEKEFSIGSYYERTDHLSSAIFYFRSVLENWPDTVAASKARERLELLGALQPARSSARSG